MGPVVYFMWKKMLKNAFRWKKMLKNAFRSVAPLISSKDKIYKPHEMAFGISFKMRGEPFLSDNY